MKTFYSIIILTFTALNVFSQPAKDSLEGWHLKDLNEQGYAGISLQQAYSFLKGKKSTPVIVAVIDSGLDTLHEDLKSVLWTNPKEIPGNGIDDDHNGYVDDIHGWNFLGGKDGKNIEKAASEKARVYHTYKSIYENKNIDTNKLSKIEKYKYITWKTAQKEIEPSSDLDQRLDVGKRILAKLHVLDSILQINLDKKEYTIQDVEDAKIENPLGKKTKMNFLQIMYNLSFSKDTKYSTLYSEIKESVDKWQDDADAKTKVPQDIRAEIVKDDYNNIKDKYYGNNDIMGKDCLHGTHVSGIIAADRKNNVGINGVADNVSIMMLRAVPNGDEYDKDIALSIHYAVDNGAKVINMSFGKDLSPEKQWVDEAFQYAANHDVLLVHAAGNEHENIDTSNNFPSPKLLNGNRANNVITVGASSDKMIAQKNIADFSNYGHQEVDVFAPGEKIYSSLPGGNNYGFLDGTSMATPVVAGVAALIRSYYPTLTATQVKKIIEKSVTPCDSSFSIVVPGTDTTVPMTTLCASGGIVNAYNAVKNAEIVSSKKPHLQKKTIKKL